MRPRQRRKCVGRHFVRIVWFGYVNCFARALGGVGAASALPISLCFIWYVQVIRLHLCNSQLTLSVLTSGYFGDIAAEPKTNWQVHLRLGAPASIFQPFAFHIGFSHQNSVLRRWNIPSALSKWCTLVICDPPPHNPT